MTQDDSMFGGTTPNRRRFLTQVATTGAVAFGTAAVSGTAGAATRPDLEERYPDPLFTKVALDEHGGEVLSLLAEEGLLERGEVGELRTRRTVGMSEVATNREGTAYFHWDGDRADEIRTVTHVDDGVVELAVEPETGDAYAFFHPADEDTRYLVRSEVGVVDMNSGLCCVSCDCTNITCDGGCVEECCGRCPCSSSCNYTYNCDCMC
jgi:hypothetical protein